MIAAVERSFAPCCFDRRSICRYHLVPLSFTWPGMVEETEQHGLDRADVVVQAETAATHLGPTAPVPEALARRVVRIGVPTGEAILVG